MSLFTKYTHNPVFHFPFYYGKMFIFWIHFCLLPTWQKAESNEQRQNGLKMVDQAIWSKKMSNGMRRTPVSAEQVCIMKRIPNINMNIKSYKTVKCLLTNVSFSCVCLLRPELITVRSVQLSWTLAPGSSGLTLSTNHRFWWEKRSEVIEYNRAVLYYNN